MSRNELLAVSPIDGRYASKTPELQEICSEYGLIERRAKAMAGYFLHLQTGVLPDVEPVSDGSRDYMSGIAGNFDVTDAEAIKEIESTTNHDVKAVEVWLRQKIGGVPELNRNKELIHFGCTSEDVNSLAYALMFQDLVEEISVPKSHDVTSDLGQKADAWSRIPLLSLTHGQPATPTTLGKEMLVFRERVDQSTTSLLEIKTRAKWSGATGNYAAASIAYPEVDWRSVNREFIEKNGVEFAEPTTQIEPHDYMARIFNELALGNSIKKGLARDMWGYISRGVFGQRTKAGEVGSSTMPHKVNPIDFENAESNFDTAIAIATSLAQRLPVSRFQRDLSDSSSLRTTGEVFGHTLIADKSLLRGLGKITVNESVINVELEENWAVLTEPVQTIMRRYGVDDPYTVIKEVSRGQEFTRDTYLQLVDGLDLPVEVRQVLRGLTPDAYTGLSEELVDDLQ